MFKNSLQALSSGKYSNVIEIIDKLTKYPEMIRTFQIPSDLKTDFNNFMENREKYNNCDIFLNTPGEEAMQIYQKPGKLVLLV